MSETYQEIIVLFGEKPNANVQLCEIANIVFVLID